jgi:hypothetical protein
MSDGSVLSKYRKDPALWIKNILGVDSMQDYHKRIATDIAENDNVAIKAAHSLGKTWEMARIALWFFTVFDDSIVITTAPTYRQVKALLWGEIRSAHKTSKVPLGGRLLDVELKFTDSHYMMGFSPQAKTTATKEQQGSSFQGFHSKHVLVIFDEATGVTPDIWVMAQGLLTSGVIVKFIAIANPTTKNCSFHDCFSSPDWKKITINCFDSPNLIANGLTSKEELEDEIDRLTVMPEEERLNEIKQYKKPVPYLLTAQFVVPYVMRLGFDHPLVLSKVFGEFPRDEDNVLVQYEDVEKAMKREVPLDPHIKRTIGVDVARFGIDKTVITELMGYKNTDIKTLVKRDLVHVTGEVVRMIKSRNCPTIVLVDATGLGAGVYDNLIESQREGAFHKDVQIEEIHFGGSPTLDGQNEEEQAQDKSRYFNLKAKLFDLLGSDLKHHIDLMEQSEFLEELPSIQYKFDSKGRIVIESKKDYKIRTKRPSPDYSDSLALANYGRYVSIKYGSFKGNISAKPLAKQDLRKERRTGIKVREY